MWFMYSSSIALVAFCEPSLMRTPTRLQMSLKLGPPLYLLSLGNNTRWWHSFVWWTIASGLCLLAYLGLFFLTHQGVHCSQQVPPSNPPARILYFYGNNQYKDYEQYGEAMCLAWLFQIETLIRVSTALKKFLELYPHYRSYPLSFWPHTLWSREGACREDIYTHLHRLKSSFWLSLLRLSC